MKTAPKQEGFAFIHYQNRLLRVDSYHLLGRLTDRHDWSGITRLVFTFLARCAKNLPDKKRTLRQLTIVANQIGYKIEEMTIELASFTQLSVSVIVQPNQRLHFKASIIIPLSDSLCKASIQIYRELDVILGTFQTMKGNLEKDLGWSFLPSS